MYGAVLAVIALLGAALAIVQLASDAVFAQNAVAIAVPRAVPAAFGRNVFGFLDRVAPAPYVEAMLASDALARHDAEAARMHALRMAPSAERDEFVARAAQERGDDREARQAFVAAGDYLEVNNEVRRLATSDFAAAYRLEDEMIHRLEGSGTHPDAVAEAYWQIGTLASQRAATAPHARRWNESALRSFRRAVALSPLSGKYLLALGTQSLAVGQLAAARDAFGRASDVDPGSSDAFAGLAVVCARSGEPALAARYANRSRRLGGSPLLHQLQQ